jgi:hypothetical protein
VLRDVAPVGAVYPAGWHLPSGLVLLHIAGATGFWLATLHFYLGLTTGGLSTIAISATADSAGRIGAPSGSTLPALSGPRPAQP